MYNNSDNNKKSVDCSSPPYYYSFSQLPGDPSFRNAAVNAVAVVPLLSSHLLQHQDNNNKATTRTTHSVRSFEKLTLALRRHNRRAARPFQAPPPSPPPASLSSKTTQASSPQLNDDSYNNNDLLLIVPNSSLTRPGDWRYNETPLKGFHWQHGCQRLRWFDGRPEYSRSAHDRLLNPTVTRDWMDLCPSRRTAAVIGVLNLRDCETVHDLHRAEEELQSLAERYATPPYEATAHGKVFDRDRPVQRLFVFDSFQEECQQRINLSQSKMGQAILAFPPVDLWEDHDNDDDDNNNNGKKETTTPADQQKQQQHSQMLDLHLNVVVNDLAVAIFRNLERKILESDAICQSPHSSRGSSSSSGGGASSVVKNSLSRMIASAAASSSTGSGAGAGSSGADKDVEKPMARHLSLSNMATLVNPESKLAKDSSSSSSTSSSSINKATQLNSPFTSFTEPKTPTASSLTSGTSSSSALATSTPKLLTPIDSYWETASLSARDLEAIRKRDVGRREKFAADLALLAGSPLDAYERYLKAAEWCKTGTPDPLWYASALEGCAAAHIAMAEAGGYGVDEYLEHNFQMPDGTYLHVALC